MALTKQQHSHIEEILPFRKKRIEYIDAMRGFTMLLVVYSHVSLFCLDTGSIELFTYNDLFSEFRMPLFFFISGFVFYKDPRIWDFHQLKQFLLTKIRIQLIAPFLFLALFCFVQNKSLIHIATHEFMAGYWFTYALFYYYLLYIAFDLFLSKLSRIGSQRSFFRDLFFITIGVSLYLLASPSISKKLPINEDVLVATGFTRLHLFIFFVLGTLIKKRFVSFENEIDKGYVSLFAIVSFILSNVFLDFFSNTFFHSMLYFIAVVSGILLVFSFFKVYQDFFKVEKKIGQWLQYLGKRTLDVYLIHYFFVNTSWSIPLPVYLKEYPLLEFIISISLSIIVVCICLLVSSILRTSPHIASFLFGQKKR